MVMSREDDAEGGHPFWYALVLGIFHTEVAYTGTCSSPQKRMDFLWVKWMGLKRDYQFGWAKRRLPRIGFIEDESSAAYGFLGPEVVLRAVQVLPVRHLDGKPVKPGSIIIPFVSSKAEVEKYEWYDVNMYVF